MLVLTRQRDETIMIGEIEVTVVDIRGDKVRLGITAPTSVAVHRKEVYESIKRENELAARISGTDLTTLSLPSAPVRPGLSATQKAAIQAKNRATKAKPLEQRIGKILPSGETIQVQPPPNSAA